MRTLLLYPPITDPTSGYHSLCYIETFARREGFQEIDILDTNIEALLHSMCPEQIQNVRSHIKTRRSGLERQPKLNGAEQMELYYLWKSESFEFEALDEAVSVMRDPGKFYDYSYYRPAAEMLHNWLNVLSVLAYPGQFSGYSLHNKHQYNLNSTEDMGSHEVTRKISAPFEPYFREILLPRINESAYEMIGINVTYSEQLPFALAIGRMIRKQFPDMIILYGGTEVSDVWKYLPFKSRFFDVFDIADACVIGEGEVAFTSLLKMFGEGRKPEKIPNVLFHPKYGLSLDWPEIVYGDIQALPTPDYSKLNSDLYLSPHRYVYYSPSRGCYWNKCTFCDYGLNFDSPTSPWRQNPVDKTIQDLSEISRYAKFVYFSVDVLAPAMLLNLAEKLLEKKIDIRWGAEIRLEKYWSPERCNLLKNSGCTHISVGYESGNQRILDLIDKGTEVSKIRETTENFHGANIGVQMMGFTGFPTETFEDSLETFRFLEETTNFWTFAGIGEFGLTPGAIVAKNPERFGITNVKPFDNDDIPRYLHFEDPNVHMTPEQLKELKAARGRTVKVHFNRPWVGGLDTAHSIFYHDRFGVNIIDEINSYPERVKMDTFLELNGKITSDIMGYPVDSLLLATHPIHMQYGREGRSLTAAGMSELLSGRMLPRNDTDSGRRYFIRNDGKVFPLPEKAYEFMKQFVKGNTLEKCLADVSSDIHDLYRNAFKHCVYNHFLRIKRSYTAPEESRESELIRL